MDLAELSDEEIAQLRMDVQAEQARRAVLASAPQQADELAARVLAAKGVQQGQEWRQPEGAHDAYPKGWVATHNGAEWESLVAANPFEPGVSGWRQISTDGPAPWVQPTGAHDAYNTGDRVTYNGKVYESTVDGNVWAPDAYPQGWAEITTP